MTRPTEYCPKLVSVQTEPVSLHSLAWITLVGRHKEPIEDIGKADYRFTQAKLLYESGMEISKNGKSNECTVFSVEIRNCIICYYIFVRVKISTDQWWLTKTCQSVYNIKAERKCVCSSPFKSWAMNPYEHPQFIHKRTQTAVCVTKTFIHFITEHMTVWEHVHITFL